MNIKGQSFLKLLDFTPEQIADFLTLAAELKAKKKAGIPHRLCEGKQAALIFEKTSTRTRCSFEVAAHDLGMTVTYLDPSGSQIGIGFSFPTALRSASAFFRASYSALAAANDFSCSAASSDALCSFSASWIPSCMSRIRVQ